MINHLLLAHLLGKWMSEYFDMLSDKWMFYVIDT